ncbi:MAG: hypothetical protein K0S55_648, partial [Clostridia bacterium]|nr:hypothetical protein [Clostridia bacterium]
MKESILELKNICNGYNGVTVLKNINITFKKGEITSVIAPNGGGKTTLFKTACRLLKPASGEVLLDGKNIKEYVAKDLARRISLLPQFRPVPEMSVFDLVAQGRFPYLNLARRLSEEDKNIVNDAIIRVGIEALRDKSVELLSGGE